MNQQADRMSPAVPGVRRRGQGLVWMIALLLAIIAAKLIAFDYMGPATPFLLYFAAIIVGAWQAGWRGGLVMTIILTLLRVYYFFPPFHAMRLANTAAMVRVAVFGVEGVAITAMTVWLQSERLRGAQATLEARASLAKLEGVLRGVKDGISVQNARGEVVYVNDAAAKLSGFSSPEALRTASVPEILAQCEVLTPDGAPIEASHLPGVLALQGEPAPERLVQFRVRATGERRWALVRANAFHIEGDDTGYAVNIFQDVTETHQQQEALRVKQEWLSTTLRSIGDAVIATDGRGNVSFMNPLAERLTGWAWPSPSGKPLAEVFKIINEETRSPVESPVDRVLRGGEVVGLANHTILSALDGTEKAIDDTAAPIRSAEGEIIGAVLIFRDVSERRAEDARRTFIARATTELATSLDYRQTLSTVVRLAVPAIGDWCAVDIYEGGVLSRLAVEHIDPEKVQLVYDIEHRYPEDPETGKAGYAVVRTGQPIFIDRIPDEMFVATAASEEHLRMMRQLQLGSYIAAPLVADGSVIGVLTLATAKSGRVFGPRDLDLAIALADRAALAINHARLFAAAGAARGEAERATRAKDEFLAMLGHELRNPMAPIVTALELMKLRAPALLERERAVIGRQVRHVLTLVDDLLDVSRITTGKVELARQATELADVVEKALELAGPLIEERRHEVRVDVPRGLRVWGDPVRLGQVASNLLTNAAKYTNRGGRIEVQGAREAANVVLTVRDNGVGIDPALLPRVFDLFVQGSQSLDRSAGGLGLGLTIVRSVVELHSGRVFVASAGPNKGSTFRVVLPSLDGEPARAAPPPPPPAPQPPRGVKVLVVDDNADALETLVDALGMSGYEVHKAPDAAAAIATAAAVRPDVALLDIGLPVMDGYELADKLRHTAGLGALKLVAVTGYGQPADKERTRTSGFDDHLVKPVMMDQVLQVLGRLTGPGVTAPFVSTAIGARERQSG